MPLVLGVDSSTQSTKVEARDIETGQVLAAGSAKHPATHPPVSEQDPQSWWQALAEACEQLGPIRSHVVAMSVAGQQHGLVLLDKNDQPVRKAKLWNDTTSASQADALVERLGAAAWAEQTGSLPVAAFTVAKLAWVAEHEPNLLKQTAKVMLPHDYLTYRLTGNHVTDRGDASGSGWFNPVTNTYLPELLTIAGVDGDRWVNLLPNVAGPTETVGHLTPEASAALGLPAGIAVGPGTGDNMGSALGLGLQPGDVVMSLGTSGVAYAVSDTPTHDPSGAVAGFADATGRYLPLVCTLNATKVTDTVARLLGTDPQGLVELALAADPSGELPVLVPYFDGERTPNLPEARGALVGLTSDTTREQVALAAHDGVLCGLLDGIDALRGCGVAASGQMHLIGGGAKSAAYRQRAADLSGSSVLIPQAEEAVATGACVQAAAVVTEQSPNQVQTSWQLGTGDLVQPNPVDHVALRQRYAEASQRQN